VNPVLLTEWTKTLNSLVFDAQDTVIPKYQAVEAA